MFKKLKKKIEDGDVASPDRNPFGFSSPSTRMAVPGIPVRLPSETEMPQETEGNDSSAQGVEDETTELRTGVESVADGVPKTGVPPVVSSTLSAGADPSVDATSVEKTPSKASTGWSASLGVKAQGLTSMIRGDSSAQQQVLGECVCVHVHTSLQACIV